MTISIEAIFRTPAAACPMDTLQRATLLKGVGLEGDRYAQRVGTYSVLKASIHKPGEQEPGRQLTLISAEGVKAAFEQKSIAWTKSFGDLRRNIVLKGISSHDLLDSIGTIIHLGDSGTKLLVHRNCVPCMYNERKNQTPGLMEALWDAGGVSCEVLEGGDIAVGDEVTVGHPNGEGLPVDAGHRSEGFFIRPSKRTAAMVRDALEGSRALHGKLFASDPEGVDRAQASYDSVGLSFWPKSNNK
jgi:MOSC domain-containing protein YiiM